MSGKIGSYVRRHHLAMVALFFALTGGAYAMTAAKNSVKSKSIKDGQVRSVDVQDNGLTGVDIDEASLGQVPSAASSGGVTETSLKFSVPDQATPTPVASINGLNISMDCDIAGADTDLFLKGTSTGDRGTAEYVQAADTANDNAAVHTRPLIDATPLSIQLSGTPTFLRGIASFRHGSQTVEATFELRKFVDGFGTTDDCFLNGFARSSP